MKEHFFSPFIFLLLLNTISAAQNYHSLPAQKTNITEVIKEGKSIRTMVTEKDRKGRNVTVTTRKSDSSKYQVEAYSYWRRRVKIEYFEGRDSEDTKKLKKTEIITRDFLGKISQREIIYPDTTRNRTTTYRYDRFNRKIEEIEERGSKPYRRRTRTYDWHGHLIRQQTFDAYNECIYDKVTTVK